MIVLLFVIIRYMLRTTVEFAGKMREAKTTPEMFKRD